jgi:hypothetical protein
MFVPKHLLSDFWLFAGVDDGYFRLLDGTKSALE